MSDAVDIQIRPSGPYLVRGPITLHDGDGNVLGTADKEVIALCRCRRFHDEAFLRRHAFEHRLSSRHASGERKLTSHGKDVGAPLCNDDSR